MTRFAELGLEIEITELDVALPQGAPVTAELLAHQAAIYGALAEACQQVEACRTLTVWGVSDNHTWLAGTNPLPFDSGYQPKPAWDALIDGASLGAPIYSEASSGRSSLVSSSDAAGRVPISPRSAKKPAKRSHSRPSM